MASELPYLKEIAEQLKKLNAKGGDEGFKTIAKAIGSASVNQTTAYTQGDTLVVANMETINMTLQDALFTEVMEEVDGELQPVKKSIFDVMSTSLVSAIIEALTVTVQVEGVAVRKGLAALMNEMNTKLDDILADIHSISESQQGIEGALDGTNPSGISARVASVDTRLSDANTKLDSIDTSIGGMGSDVATIKSDLADIKSDVDTMEADVYTVKERIGSATGSTVMSKLEDIRVDTANIRSQGGDIWNAVKLNGTLDSRLWTIQQKVTSIDNKVQ